MCFKILTGSGWEKAPELKKLLTEQALKPEFGSLAPAHIPDARA